QQQRRQQHQAQQQNTQFIPTPPQATAGASAPTTTKISTNTLSASASASAGNTPLMTDFLPEDFDMFDAEFNINDADLEAMIADATQGFWVNFPGEVGIY
ncbi:hypothetical protein LTS18_005200, partial [Coniosporium uncinatum]